MEKFYCVGSKQHYELEVLEVAEKPSKGGSIRYSIVSRSPPGHKVTKICKKEVYDYYADKLSGKEAEDTTPVEAPASEPEGSEPIPAGPSSTPEVDDASLAVPQAFCAECSTTFEACGCEKKRAEDFEAEVIDRYTEKDGSETVVEEHEIPYSLAGKGFEIEAVDANIADKTIEITYVKENDDFEADFSQEAETVVGTMTPGVSLEALTPLEGGLENGDGEPLVPADDFLPEGEGRVIGSQSTSHNYTPMHAEDVDDEEDVCDSCGIVCGLDEMIYFVDDNDDVHKSACYTCFDSEEVEMIYVGEPRSWADRNRAKLATAAAALALGILYFNSQKKE